MGTFMLILINWVDGFSFPLLQENKFILLSVPILGKEYTSHYIISFLLKNRIAYETDRYTQLS